MKEPVKHRQAQLQFTPSQLLTLAVAAWVLYSTYQTLQQHGWWPF